jgi:hypothetical protein
MNTPILTQLRNLWEGVVSFEEAIEMVGIGEDDPRHKGCEIAWALWDKSE